MSYFGSVAAQLRLSCGSVRTRLKLI